MYSEPYVEDEVYCLRCEYVAYSKKRLKKNILHRSKPKAIKTQKYHKSK